MGNKIPIINGKRYCSYCKTEHPVTKEYWYFTKDNRRNSGYPIYNCKIYNNKKNKEKSISKGTYHNINRRYQPSIINKLRYCKYCEDVFPLEDIKHWVTRKNSNAHTCRIYQNKYLHEKIIQDKKIKYSFHNKYYPYNGIKYCKHCNEYIPLEDLEHWSKDKLKRGKYEYVCKKHKEKLRFYNKLFISFYYLRIKNKSENNNLYFKYKTKQIQTHRRIKEWEQKSP